jgi:hypothetical protein
MSRFEQYTFSILCLIVLGLCAGCRSSEVEDAVAESSAVVVLTPIAASYGAAYESDVVTQNSSIATAAPTQLYSQKVTLSELWQKSMQHGHKFHEPWKYMGTKNGEHYLALYPFLGFREIYRIDETEYEIEESFELTSRSYQWREIFKYSYSGIDQTLVIEPLMMEGPGGEFRAGLTVTNVGIEDAFMMEVPILEKE